MAKEIKTSTPKEASGTGGYTVASTYLTALINAAINLGINTVECFTGSGMNPFHLLDLPPRISNTTVRIVAGNILRSVGSEKLALEYLKVLGNLSHGLLSVIGQSSPSLIECLQAISLYSRIQIEDKAFQFRHTGSFYSLDLIDMSQSKDGNPEIDKFICLAALFSLANAVSQHLPGEVVLGKIYLAFKVDNPNVVREINPRYKIYSKQKTNSIQFLSELQFNPIINSRSIFKEAFFRCDKYFRSRQLNIDVAARVKHIFLISKSINLTINDVASELFMCPRSLQRKLNLEGTNFREIKLTEQICRAQYYLESTAMPIEQIASELGYSHPSNFIRQFKSVKNESPNKYRKRTSLDKY